jgi:hypothetical protein
VNALNLAEDQRANSGRTTDPIISLLLSPDGLSAALVVITNAEGWHCYNDIGKTKILGKRLEQ